METVMETNALAIRRLTEVREIVKQLISQRVHNKLSHHRAASVGREIGELIKSLRYYNNEKIV